MQRDSEISNYRIGIKIVRAQEVVTYFNKLMNHLLFKFCRICRGLKAFPLNL